MMEHPTDISPHHSARELAGIAEVIKSLAVLAQQPSEPQSSVELTQNAKGATQITVKVYHRDPDQAAATAQRLYDDLATTYRASAAAPDARAA